MGEWSDYFEDFPEENSANYDEHGRYDPNHFLRNETKRQALANKRLDEVLALKGSSCCVACLVTQCVAHSVAWRAWRYG